MKGKWKSTSWWTQKWGAWKLETGVYMDGNLNTFWCTESLCNCSSCVPLLSVWAQCQFQQLVWGWSHEHTQSVTLTCPALHPTSKTSLSSNHSRQKDRTQTQCFAIRIVTAIIPKILQNTEIRKTYVNRYRYSFCLPILIAILKSFNFLKIMRCTSLIRNIIKLTASGNLTKHTIILLKIKTWNKWRTPPTVPWRHVSKIWNINSNIERFTKKKSHLAL